MTNVHFIGKGTKSRYNWLAEDEHYTFLGKGDRERGIHVGNFSVGKVIPKSFYTSLFHIRNKKYILK